MGSAAWTLFNQNSLNFSGRWRNPRHNSRQLSVPATDRVRENHGWTVASLTRSTGPYGETQNLLGHSGVNINKYAGVCDWNPNWPDHFIVAAFGRDKRTVPTWCHRYLKTMSLHLLEYEHRSCGIILNVYRLYFKHFFDVLTTYINFQGLVSGIRNSSVTLDLVLVCLYSILSEWTVFYIYCCKKTYLSYFYLTYLSYFYL